MTHTHALVRRAVTAVALVVAAVGVSFLFAAPAFAQEAGDALDAPIALPVGWGPVIVGLIVSILSTLVTKASAPGWVKVAVAVTISAVAAVAENLAFNAWTFVPAELGMTFLMTWVWQLLAYFGFTKPVLRGVLAPDSGITAPAERRP